MKPFDVDVPACRSHVERCKAGILTGLDAAIVKQQVTGMVQSIFGDCPLTGQASQLPLPMPVGMRRQAPFGQQAMVPRNDQFNASLDTLLKNVDQAFVDIEDYQRRRAENTHVAKGEVRESILAFFARKPMEMQWGTEPIFELGLSEEQVLDGLHYLEDHGLIEGGGKLGYLDTPL